MTTNLDWKNLGFSYYDTGSYVSASYINNRWHGVEKHKGAHFNLHIAAGALHYGQSCFEGLKAFRQKNGTVAVFRIEENARRIMNSAQRLAMQAPPEELFIDAVVTGIKENWDYIPPYGTGASLYIRPLLIGNSPVIGVNPCSDYLFIVLVTPVGPYYPRGFKPIKAYVQEGYDRAAPKGLGCIKAAGNYASALKGDMEIRSKGYQVSLYLDSSTHTYIDEFTTSNFIAITEEGGFVTPNSNTILPSITNKSLQTIARDFGMTVETRPILFSEVERFAEVGACGTAAIITPIHSITRGETVLTFGSDTEPGKYLTKLYNSILDIQFGNAPDTYRWMHPVKINT